MPTRFATFAAVAPSKSAGKRQQPIILTFAREAEDWKRLIELHKGAPDKAGCDLAEVNHTGRR